jgi:hypothetical protein
MIAMGMVQMTVYQVVEVIAMRNLRMATVGAVNMPLLMASTLMARCATFRIRGRYFENAFIDVVAVCVMQMPIVEIVDMPIVFDGKMPAIGTMLMFVAFHFRASAHGYNSNLWTSSEKNTHFEIV